MSVKPMSGVNLLVSLFILGFVKRGRELGKGRSRKIIFSVILLIFIFNYLLFSFIIGVSNLTPNFITAKEITTNQCEYKSNTLSDRNIILRIDDIQAYYNKELQLIMLRELDKRNITASLGVIPLDLSNDERTTSYLTEHKCDFEIALHGYDHSDYEFKNLSYSEAKEKLEKGLDELNKIEEHIITFIPPQNEISTKAKSAVYEEEIKIISEYDFTVSTYNWEEERLNEVSYVVEECQKEFEKDKTCILMLHPQDYMKDYGKYLELLDSLEKMNATFINFKDIYYNK